MGPELRAELLKEQAPIALAEPTSGARIHGLERERHRSNQIAMIGGRVLGVKRSWERAFSGSPRSKGGKSSRNHPYCPIPRLEQALVGDRQRMQLFLRAPGVPFDNRPFRLIRKTPLI
jgi:hypothetical protein